MGSIMQSIVVTWLEDRQVKEYRIYYSWAGRILYLMELGGHQYGPGIELLEPRLPYHFKASDDAFELNESVGFAFLKVAELLFGYCMIEKYEVNKFDCSGVRSLTFASQHNYTIDGDQL
jgi:hypothetical protein